MSKTELMSPGCSTFGTTRRAQESDASQEFPSVVSMLRLFALAGDGFAEGAKSLEEISHTLRSRSRYRNGQMNVSCDIHALDRCCRDTEVYFGRHLRFTGKAVLFSRSGGNRRITGMTELGVECWALAHDVLVHHGIIKEGD